MIQNQKEQVPARSDAPGPHEPQADAPDGDILETEPPVARKQRAVDDTIIKWLAVIGIIAILTFAIVVPDVAA
ncbi:hypothetical protein [Arthrobacter castelli]|uniref:hypothetical protein n=1 Tax=Arthrobacter castelli TaxID=271431 RepID=UPI0003FA2887|nr:hypothetical protein [Arthrobacter castelli]